MMQKSKTQSWTRSLVSLSPSQGKLKAPRIPVSLTDPGRVMPAVAKMRREIARRYLSVKRDLKALFDDRLVGHYREGNSAASWILCHQRGGMPTLYRVNAGNFIYQMTPEQIDALLADVKTIIDRYLVEGGKDEIWALEYVTAQIKQGTFDASTNLAHQSELYAGMTTISSRMNSPAIMNQVAHARMTTFNDWTGISDAARADLSNVLTDAVVRGVNPRETARVISARLDVSESKARAIAQTEQVGALRSAQRAETDWARDELGLNVKMLWLSALKTVTRPWHAARHGLLYTTEEIEAFYAVNGNKFNCYCAQIPAALNEDGELANPGLAEKLAKQREAWRGKGGRRATATGTHTPPAAPPAAPPAPPKQRPAPKFEPKPVPTYKPPHWEDQPTLGKLNKYATGRVADFVKVPAGSDVKVANDMMRMMAEIQDRFGIEKAKYLGSFKGNPSGVKYKQGKNTLAAYSARDKAVLLASKGLDLDRYARSNAYALSKGWISGSRAFAIRSDDNELIAVINELDEMPHNVVATPRGTMAHEYGHALHRENMEAIDAIGQTAFRRGWGHALSVYGQTKYSELIAESFALYIERPNEARRRLYPPLYNAFRKLDKAAK